jgi:nitrous oxide reductase accessory protein NosL
MNKTLAHWLVSNERVHYNELDVPSLANKPLDKPQIIIKDADEYTSQASIKTLISTKDLPKNPKENDAYQVGDHMWTWVNGEWRTTTGLRGH